MVDWSPVVSACAVTAGKWHRGFIARRNERTPEHGRPPLPRSPLCHHSIRFKHILAEIVK